MVAFIFTTTINNQFVLRNIDEIIGHYMVTDNSSLISITGSDEYDFSYIGGLKPIIETYKWLEQVFTVEAFAQSDAISFQNTVKTPLGDMTACSGNFILPSTICTGSDKNDTIIGTVAGGIIFGNEGNDKIRGLLSQQIIFGNEGNDSIQGGNSTNIVFGNNGDDVIVGGSGFDPMKGGGGSMLAGNSGNDQLIGGPDHDVLEGGPGSDFFQCNGKTDLVLDFHANEDKVSGNCIFT